MILPLPFNKFRDDSKCIHMPSEAPLEHPRIRGLSLALNRDIKDYSLPTGLRSENEQLHFRPLLPIHPQHNRTVDDGVMCWLQVPPHGPLELHGSR
jgi:hypothetical protein